MMNESMYWPETVGFTIGTMGDEKKNVTSRYTAPFEITSWENFTILGQNSTGSEAPIACKQLSLKPQIVEHFGSYNLSGDTQ